MFTKSIIITLISAGISASGAHAGLFGYTFNKLTDSGAPAVSNPCHSESFNKEYGKFCSGLFTKTIRCLSEGGNPGVCDSSAVCDTLDRTAKNLCETHCLNTDPKNMGNQAIKISCSPTSSVQKNQGRNTVNPFEEGRIGTTFAFAENPAAEWIDASTKGSSPADIDLPSIRSESEGAQDSQNSEANFYKTEHPKSFDEINTEKPWDPSFDYFGSYPLAGSSKVFVGGHMHRSHDQHESPPSDERQNPWDEDDNDIISTYPLDEVDQAADSLEIPMNYNHDTIDDQEALIRQEDSWVMPTDFKGYTKTSYHGILEDRFFTMPD